MNPQRMMRLSGFGLLFALVAAFASLARCSAQPSITITAPQNGSVLYRGDNLQVQFQTDLTMTNLILGGDFKGAFPGVSTGNNTLGASVATDAQIGKHQIVVSGVENGLLVVSDPINIIIDTPLSISSLTSDPSSINLQGIGDSTHLLLLATLADGSKDFVTGSPKLSFTSANPAIASVDPNGNVTATGLGNTFITINGPISGPLVLTAVVSGTPLGILRFSPLPGTYASPQVISLSGAPGSTIYYTTDGSLPTEKSTRYVGSIAVGSTETISAFATSPNLTDSVIIQGLFVIQAPVAAPTFTPSAGTFATAQTVSLSDAISAAAIYYTTNGTTPTAGSTLYSGPITVGSTETIQAIAVANGYTNSAVASATYTINIPVAAAPTFSPPAGTFTAPQSVSISTTTARAAIYYTTNGTTPTTNSTLYSGPITVGSTETIQAIAVANGYTNSAITSATYTINLPQDFTFSLSASALTVTAGQSGTLTTSIGPVNGFNQAVSFTCSGLPVGATCSFSPTTVTPNGTGLATTTVTVTTTARAGLLTGHRPFELAGLMAGLSLWLAGRRFRKLRRVGILFMVAIGVGSVVSCGKAPATQEPVTSTVSINAASGSLTHTSTFSLTVQ